MKYPVTRPTPTLSTRFKTSKITELLDRGVRVRMHGMLYKEDGIVRERILPDAFGRGGRPVREPHRDPAVPPARLDSLCAALDDEAFHRVTHGWWRS